MPNSDRRRSTPDPRSRPGPGSGLFPGVSIAGGIVGLVAAFVFALSAAPATRAATVATPGVTQQSDEGPTSVGDGVYTDAQAERGGELYQERCSVCHTTDQFSGAVFISSWAEQPLHGLFQLMRTTMPEDNPGSLKRQEYADVLAYFLKLNGFPAGDQELASTDQVLKRVKFPAP